MSSWSNSLSANGFDVTVITRQWKAGAQQLWEDYFSEYSESEAEEEWTNQNLKIIRVPYRWSRPFKTFKSHPLPSLFYWYMKALGNFHFETNAYSSLKAKAVEELCQHTYDFIIVSSPPLNIIRLGVELKKKFNVPLVIDFRDSYENSLLNPNYRPGLKSKIEIFLFRSYLKKWLRNADLITSVSQAVIDTLSLKRTQRRALVMNGYEDDAVSNKKAICTPKFVISFVGSLYPNQDIAFMTKGLAAFIKEVNPQNLSIRFIGIKSRKEIRKKIEEHIDVKYLHFTDRVSRADALAYMQSSSILLQIGWKGYRGYCPGKVFEYLAAKRNILIAPADGDLTDKVIAETHAGKSVATEREMTTYLLEKYNEWEIQGYLTYNGLWAEIEKYSRANQNRKLINALLAFEKESKIKKSADQTIHTSFES